MSDEIKRDRSPNCPKYPLSEAVELVKTLYKRTGKSKVEPVVAASVWGYASLNGSALTAIGALNQYGLLDKDESGNLSVSAPGIQLLHPTDDHQKLDILRLSALRPKVFEELFTNGFHKSEESVIANQLIQNGFTHDAAKKVAFVFKSNIDLAQLDNTSIRGPSDAISDAVNTLKTQFQDTSPRTLSGMTPSPRGNEPDRQVQLPISGKKTYSVPLGDNEATITFANDALVPEDFDALLEYIGIFKKQFERKLKSQETKSLAANLSTAA